MRKQFPKVLVLKEKHENRYFHVTSETNLHATAHAVLLDRILEGWYFEDEHEHGAALAREASRTGAPAGAAWKFLLSRARNGYEYESVSLEEYSDALVADTTEAK